MPPFSRVGALGVGTVLGPRITGVLGWVPCMLLGLARRIGLLYGLLLLLVGLCASTLEDDVSASAAWPSTPLNSNTVQPSTYLFMGRLCGYASSMSSISRYPLGWRLLTETSFTRCNTS